MSDIVRASREPGDERGLDDAVLCWRITHAARPMQVQLTKAEFHAPRIGGGMSEKHPEHAQLNISSPGDPTAMLDLP